MDLPADHQGGTAEEAVKTAPLGPYTLETLLGEGGFGTVWRARQHEPFHREVAVKIIKLGMDSRAVIARFEQERQALALMNHPHIARMLDAGTTADGRPYFAMDLVEGIGITDYCNRYHLDTRERIKLFSTVCSAVQHAHQKGIIHRDLKPSNILVAQDGSGPNPKIIDFGVAKATQAAALPDQTLFTRFHQTIGTPLYMSPEQAGMSSLDIDTRSDIYSLGVLLYELLAGHPPYDLGDLSRRGAAEIRRHICDSEPVKPSTRLTALPPASLAAVASERRSDPSRLARLIKGDLDWIVLKAIAKERSKRYQSAGDLADDLGRHLAGEAITARPPSVGYRIQRLLRHHTKALALGAGVAVCLVIGVVLSAAQWLRASNEARLAEENLATLRQASPALVALALSLAGSGDFAGAIEEIDKAIEFQPSVSRWHKVKGDLLRAQLRLQDAANSYQQASELDVEDARSKQNAVHCTRLAGELSISGQLSQDSILQLYQAILEEDPSRGLLGEVGELFEEHSDEITRSVLLEMSGGNETWIRREADGRWSANFEDADIDDLAPLRGLPLFLLLLTNTNVSDLEPLRGMPLEHIFASPYAMTIAPLAGMPLRTLWINQTPEPLDLTPLASIPTLESLLLPEDAYNLDVVQRLPNLKRVSYQYDQIDESLVQTPAHFAALPLARRGDFLDAEAVLREEARHADISAPSWQALPAVVLARDDGAAYRRLCSEMLEKGLSTGADGNPRTAARIARYALLTSPPSLSDGEIADLFARVGDFLDNGETGWKPFADLTLGLHAFRSGDEGRALSRLRDAAAGSLPEVSATAFAVEAMLHHASGRSSGATTALTYAHCLLSSVWPDGDLLTWRWHDWLVAQTLFEQARQLVGPPGTIDPLLAQATPWRWLHPNDGTDPATADPDFHTTFASPDFDDSSWQEAVPSPDATAGFGYGEDWFTGVDIGEPPTGQRHTAYFRCRFNSEHGYAGIFLRCTVDDGIIVYLDGTEVARLNVGGGVEAHDLPASSTASSIGETYLHVIPLEGALSAGQHTLAISLHNVSPTSSDLRIGSISLYGIDTTEANRRGLPDHHTADPAQ